MKIYATCEACNKKRLFIRKRKYTVHQTGDKIVSKSMLCRNCYKNIKSLIK